MEYAAIIAAAVSLISELVASGQNAEAQKLREDIVRQFGPEIVPHLERAEAQQAADSTLSGMQEDPRLRGAQMDALSQLQNIYDTGGMTEADKAALELANDTVSARASSDAAQLAQSMRQRAGANSGLAFGAQAAASQGATNALGQMARQNQADARARALRALEATGQLAGDIRGDDFRRMAAIADAQDRINMFNTGLRADADKWNRNLPQMNFDNQMSVLTARANAVNGVAAGYDRGAEGTRDMGAGVANSALTYGMWGEEKNKGNKKGGA